MKPMMMKKWKWDSMVPLVMPTSTVEHHTSPADTTPEPSRRWWRSSRPATAQSTGTVSATAIGSGGVAEREPDDRQHGHVNEQHPMQQAVTAPPVGFTESVAPRKNVG